MHSKKFGSSSKKPFIVFEAGAGMVPSGLVKRAAQSEKRGKNRRFIGVDIKLGPNWLSLLGARLFRMPSNISLKKADVLNSLLDLRPKSQDIVFESYLLNNLTPKQRLNFFKRAKKVLKSNGRLVIVQDKAVISIYIKIATKLGFTVTVLEIPDLALKKSSSKAIRDRSTPRKRLKYLRHYARNGSDMPKNLQRAFEIEAINSKQEYARPTMLVLQKPKKTKKKKPARKNS